jgi:hypothetical protein
MHIKVLSRLDLQHCKQNDIFQNLYKRIKEWKGAKSLGHDQHNFKEATIFYSMSHFNVIYNLANAQTIASLVNYRFDIYNSE